MDNDRRIMFDDAWLNMQARKVYRVVADGTCRAPRSVIQKVHQRFGVKGVCGLYKKLEAFGVKRGHDARLFIKEETDE